VADSTRTNSNSPRLPRLGPFCLALAILALASVALPARAFADGDPASDVLVAQRLFLPQDAGLPVRQQAELGALLNAAQRSGYPLRVAVIASPTDLGSITELWRQPANYARFLGQELSLIYKGTLLVVMPDGFGLYHPAGNAAAQRAALARTRPAAPPAIGASAIAAVQRLAAAAGHPLKVEAVAAPAAPGAADYTAWLALAAGALVIVLAWVVSLRARPLRTPPESAG
jgi:hypothetical protein